MTGETRFTDGSWKCSGLQVIAPGRGVIANCPTPQNGGVMECSFNVDLIGAAKDLYEALAMLGKWFEKSGSGLKSRWDRIPPEEVGAIVQKMHAALALARGESTTSQGRGE